MLKAGSLVTIVADPRHRWEKPFKRFSRGENRLYKCQAGIEENRWVLNGRPHVRAEMVNKNGHGTGYFYYFGLDEIRPVDFQAIDLERFM